MLHLQADAPRSLQWNAEYQWMWVGHQQPLLHPLANSAYKLGEGERKPSFTMQCQLSLKVPDHPESLRFMVINREHVGHL